MKKSNFSFFMKFFLMFLLCCLNASCDSQKLLSKDFKITTTEGKIINVNAEIARTSEERNRGFMERKKIPDGTGMIFVFEYDQILSFWMKNTPHPLSIAYISSDGTIKDIFDMTPFSLSPIESTSSCRYALEVPQGWFSKNEIKKGSKINLEPLTN